MTTAIDLTGQRFGRLLAAERIPGAKGRTSYRCLCDCGTERKIALANLRSGNTQSCGCLRRETSKDYCTRPIEQVATRQVWNYYLRNARTRQIEWKLTFEEFAALLTQPCHYCGAEGVSTTVTTWSRKTGEHRTMQHNGVDRLDSSGDYTAANSVPCCRHCNLAKLVMTKDEFLAWVSRVFNHNFGRNP